MATQKMKIAVLVSGGVDSSVALKLLKEQGHDLTAFYLKIWLEDELSFLGECPWEEDLKFVRQICEKEKIPLEIVPLQKEYFDTVVKYTINEVRAGRTPNPDVMCNSHIKFGFFMDKIDRSFDKVATGHYAQISSKAGHFFLRKAADALKDQTYFLSRLRQVQLKRALFPIGHLTKDKVRKLAHKYKLPNQNRKDSQGICFLGKLKFQDFLRHYLGEKEGDLVEFETGKKLGTHPGFFYFTIGQRKDIRLPGGPWYVVDKNPRKNIVYVSKNYHSKDKQRDTFKIKSCQWFSDAFPKQKRLQVKIRHGEKYYSCTLKKLTTTQFEVKIKGTDQGIATGQFAVFYSDKVCLGSGVIF